MNSRQILELYKMTNQFGRTIELDYYLDENEVIINKIEIKPIHLATPNVSHGGVISALADSTLGVAALAESSKEGNLVSTVEFKISYLRPAKLGDIITGVPRIRKIGKSLIFVEADILNQKNDLIATACGTFNQYPANKVF